jgi:hypothetical protein
MIETISARPFEGRMTGAAGYANRNRKFCGRGIVAVRGAPALFLRGEILSKEELAMQGLTTDRTSTGYVAIHPLDPEDKAIIAAMRAMISSSKGARSGIDPFRDSAGCTVVMQSQRRLTSHFRMTKGRSCNPAEAQFAFLRASFAGRRISL